MITMLLAVSLSSSDLNQCARTLYGEARSLPQVEQAAVVHVIANRWLKGRWGSSVRAVVRAPKQFSAWNATDPNRPAMLALRGARLRLYRARCWYVLRGRLDGWLPDSTNGANHYWHGATPYWAIGLKRRRLGRTNLVAAR